MRCQRCGSTVLPPATSCGCDSAKPATASAPATTPSPARRLVPTGNKPALVGYYLGIASIVPFVWWLGFPAVLLGGLGFAKSKSAGQGKGHAVTAIVCGVGAIVVYGGDRLGWWRVPIAHMSFGG